MRSSESGNVFFYIFICVALLAALSFAVSQGGRTSATQLTQETRNLAASEIIAYADTIAKTVSQLRLRGTSVNALSFANEFLSSGEYGDYDCVDPPDTCPAGTSAADEIFNPAGGAVVYTNPARNVTTTGTEEWLFLSGNEIEGVGKTNNDAASVDLIMALPNVREEVCIEINDLLDVGAAGAAPPDDGAIDLDEKFAPVDLPASPFSHEETIGDEDSDLTGKSEACFDENDTRFVYYKVLLPR